MSETYAMITAGMAYRPLCLAMPLRRQVIRGSFSIMPHTLKVTFTRKLAQDHRNSEHLRQIETMM